MIGSWNMKTLLLFCCIIYSNAQLDQLLSGSLVHLGPYDALVKIGSLSKRYTPLYNNDLKASRNARSLIEEVRRMFAVGFHTLAPLDPYFNPNLPPVLVDSDLALTSGKVHITNCKITGAKKFKLNLLELRLKSGRVDFGFTLPRLNVEVDLQTDILFADILPMHLSGHLSLTISGLSVLGAGQIQPKEFGKRYVYQLVALHNRVHTDDIALQFKGTQLDISQMLQNNPLAGSSGPASDFLETLKEQMNNYVAKVVLQEANKVLAGATVPQVLAYLLPENVELNTN